MDFSLFLLIFGLVGIGLRVWDERREARARTAEAAREREVQLEKWRNERPHRNPTLVAHLRRRELIQWERPGIDGEEPSSERRTPKP